MLEKFFEFAVSIFNNPDNRPWAIFLILIIVFIIFYERAKSIGLYEDIQSLFRSKKTQLKKLNERYNSDLYTNSEKENIKYDIKVIEYQILLNSKEKNLSLLIHLNGYIDPKLAASRYNKCSNILSFNEKKEFVFKSKQLSLYSKWYKVRFLYIITTLFILFVLFLTVQDFIFKYFGFTKIISVENALTLFFIIFLFLFTVATFTFYIAIQALTRDLTAYKFLRMERKKEA